MIESCIRDTVFVRFKDVYCENWSFQKQGLYGWWLYIDEAFGM